MMKNIINTFLLLFAVSFFAKAQPFDVSYQNPLRLPVSLSANFAEIRPNHFHSGVDLRVGGVAGAKLYAVADGYIARINISPFGYGKAIYINHPNGETSVYGHMNGFSEKIRKYVENVQYTQQNFKLDELIENPETLPVKKGELIGYAGNTGSSFGAHLHFEIRKTHNQMPVNVITKGIIAQPNDDVPPTIHHMAVFTLDSTFSITTPRLLKSAKVVKKGNVWVPEGNGVFEVYNPVYFGVYANDYQPNNRSKFGINHMTAYIDNVPFFAYTLDEFTFEETRYINSFIAYEELIKNSRSYVKTHVEDGNLLSVYNNVVNKGLIVLNDTLPHTIRMELFDDSKNKTVLQFKIKKSKNYNPKNSNLHDPEKYRPMLWDSSYNYNSENLKIELPRESLYSDILFTLDSSEVKNGFCPVWSIGNPNIPLQKRMTISLRPDMPEHLKSKAIIAKLNKNGKYSSVGGTWDDENKFIMANVAEFGVYTAATDSVAPTVKVAFKKGANLSNQKALTVTIADNLSGIASYNGYIDDEWALFDYDAKTRSLTYTFDATRIKKGKKHQLKVIITDGCNNSTTLNTDFVW